MPDHMQRNREQKGSVVRIGQFWCVRYADWRAEDGKRVRKQGLTHKLAPVLPEHSRLKKAPQSVEKLQREFMETINVDRDAPERCATIRQFVADVWLPFAANRYASSTVDVYRFYWKHLLELGCGDKLLRDFGTHAGQVLLDQIARKNPQMRLATLHKLKSILSAIFKLAIQQNYRSGSNPMRETTLPKALGAQETHAHDLQTIKQILSLAPESCRTILALAAYAGLSKSEIQGLTWETLSGAELTVQSSVVNGKRGEPKTNARKDAVPLIEPLRTMLELHRFRLGNPTSGVMFPTGNGTPLSLHNLFEDHIKPVLNRCVHCHKIEKAHGEGCNHAYERDSALPIWRGWHAFRRGLATNLHALGVDDKTIQRILRHSNVAMTQKAYIKTMPQQVTDAMAQLEAAVEKQTLVQ